MTWQGGKAPRDPAIATPFAPLRPLLAGHRQDAEEALQNLAHAVRDVDARVQLQIRLLDGEDIEHWDVKGGRAARATRRSGPKSADVIIVMRRETWLQIAQGRLSPFDALFAGRLRVGGDVEAAKRLVQQMSDPSVPFVPPC